MGNYISFRNPFKKDNMFKKNIVLFNREINKYTHLAIKSTNTGLKEIIQIFDDSKLIIESELLCANFITPIELSFIFSNNITLKIYKSEYNSKYAYYTLKYNGLENEGIINNYIPILFFSDNIDKIDILMKYNPYKLITN